MNKEAIKKTAVSRFDSSEGIYIVESPMLDMIIGADPDEKRAREIFEDLLQECYVSYLEGKVVGQYRRRRGRPAKGRTDLHAQIKPDTKKQLTEMATSIGCSQGEAIDYLVCFHRSKLNRESNSTD